MKFIKKIIYLVAFCFAVIYNTAAQNWTQLGYGSNSINANEPILALAAGNNGFLYAAGMFSYNDSGYNYVAKWDGIQWKALGDGINTLLANDTILTIAVDSKENVYTAGKFQDDSGYCYVAMWDGLKWSKLGELNANGQIMKLFTDSKGNVYASGDFKNDSGYCYVAKWDGQKWQELGLLDDPCKSKVFISNMLVSSKGELWMTSKKVCRWNGSTWEEMFDFDDYVRAIAEDEHGNIYVGGDFVNSDQYTYVSKWDGKYWDELGIGKNAIKSKSIITSIQTAKGSDLVYATRWTLEDSLGNGYITQWNGNTWSSVALDSYKKINFNNNKYVWTSAIDMNNNLYVSGYYTDSVGRYFVMRYGFYLGISDIVKDHAISVFPNPTADFIYIYSESFPTSNIYIYDMLGHCVLNSFWMAGQRSKSVDVSALPKGMYILKIANATAKFVVE
ncbi:MAG: T9SS type A sorting domain-containing protein [Bacteroidetes bacterium]|nr:T9SS type A sorting domain-containing protein [Bacteroidota bacterium]